MYIDTWCNSIETTLVYILIYFSAFYITLAKTSLQVMTFDMHLVYLLIEV